MPLLEVEEYLFKANPTAERERGTPSPAGGEEEDGVSQVRQVRLLLTWRLITNRRDEQGPQTGSELKRLCGL